MIKKYILPAFIFLVTPLLLVHSASADTVDSLLDYLVEAEKGSGISAKRDSFAAGFAERQELKQGDLRESGTERFVISGSGNVLRKTNNPAKAVAKKDSKVKN